MTRCRHPKKDRIGFAPRGQLRHELCSACGRRRYERADHSWWPFTMASTVADLEAEANEVRHHLSESEIAAVNASFQGTR